MKEKKRLTPTERRKKVPNVFSNRFMLNIANNKEACFVPLSEYRRLEKKYAQLFARYQKETS